MTVFASNAFQNQAHAQNAFAQQSFPIATPKCLGDGVGVPVVTGAVTPAVVPIFPDPVRPSEVPEMGVVTLVDERRGS
jgi:hypothetical protein